VTRKLLMVILFDHFIHFLSLKNRKMAQGVEIKRH